LINKDKNKHQNLTVIWSNHMRKPVIAGNWKMHNTISEALDLVRGVKPQVEGVTDVEIIVSPVYTALASVAAELKGSNINVASQNIFWEEKGAFTGEVAPNMITDAGCTHAIIGHSERRQYFGETDQTVNKRVKAALSVGLIPIVCVGETLEERDSGKTIAVVDVQVKGGLVELSAEDIAKIIIAYEPVWAIGTGKTATPDMAEEVHKQIRSVVADISDASIADGTRILYGGSVKPENVDDLMAQPDIDGALVGGAALKVDSFVRLVKFDQKRSAFK
jgi:triosephosphate isomerase